MKSDFSLHVQSSDETICFKDSLTRSLNEKRRLGQMSHIHCERACLPQINPITFRPAQKTPSKNTKSPA